MFSKFLRQLNYRHIIRGCYFELSGLKHISFPPGTRSLDVHALSFFFLEVKPVVSYHIGPTVNKMKVI